MRPSSIRKLACSSDEHEIATSRFLMRWIAWEAFMFRLIVTTANDQGWSVKDAEVVVDSARASSARGYRDLLHRLTGQQGLFVQDVWNAITTIERVRNKVAHGVLGQSTGKLDTYSAFLKQLVLRPKGWILTPLDSSGVLQPRRPVLNPKPIAQLYDKLQVRPARAQEPLPRSQDDAIKLCRIPGFTA